MADPIEVPGSTVNPELNVADEAESAAEVLRRAADRVTFVRSLSSGGHWVTGPGCVIDKATGRVVISDRNVAEFGFYDWIALLGPQIAGPLAAWLRQAADQLERHLPAWRRGIPDDWEGDTPLSDTQRRTDEEVATIVDGQFGVPLRVARVILGETT